MNRKYFLAVVLTTSVFSLLTATDTWATDTETVLYTLGSGVSGRSARTALIQDSAGNLYGTTPEGGIAGAPCNSSCGVVFELSPASGGGWTYTNLYSFTGASDGSSPFSALVFDVAGNLYGTTLQGGRVNSNCLLGCGTVYELSPASGGGWTFSTIYSFQGGRDGATPLAALIFDSAGKLYGTAIMGGLYGSGIVFRLSHSAGGTWNKSVLYSFKGGDDGAGPLGIVSDASGNLFGVAPAGGATFEGTVYELSPSTSGNGWKFRLVHTFKGAANGDGESPYGTLILGKAGDLYGTTFLGGDATCLSGSGCGTVFALKPTSKGWSESVLHAFSNGDGFGPDAELVADGKGDFYGTTTSGGGQGWGTIFEESYTSSGWVFVSLYSFQAGNGGTFASSGLIVGADGNLYGTTESGGTYNWGVIYELAIN
jgi:uncharacterized repeat protein (TIGR03803 family)